MRKVIFSLIVIILSAAIVFQLQTDSEIKTYLENSVPFLGTEIPRMQGVNGEGIVVAVIDTGVDFNHPDLNGWGPNGKVIGGFNFLDEDQLPIDNNGHGTQVAGIIAADGNVFGIAPKAKILAYKVSEDGEGVSSELIIKAIERAIEDKADIINISLGVNKTNSRIDSAVNKALEKEIFVVTAAGNDGPKSESIGSPGRNPDSVTVGATYNNLTSSLVATLEVNEKPYTVIPMLGAKKLDEPAFGKIIFAEYGRVRDFENLDVKNSIVLVERGSDVKNEVVYFSTKEKNAADNGAAAMIVYNNESGIFLGELVHEFTEPDYSPRIPVVSLDRKDGLEIKESIQDENKGFLHLFYNPDFVAHFSSRGPVSPFYIKPDIVAPGAYINTTQSLGGYNFTSGTSYAAPHVSGAAALIMQKYPDIHHHEVRSLLLTTASKVTDAYGNEFSINDAGAGRVNVSKALDSNLIIEPPIFVESISSYDRVIQKEFSIKKIKNDNNEIKISFEGPEFLEFENTLDDNILKVRISATENSFGEHEGKIILNHDNLEHAIPFLIHFTEGAVSTKQNNGKISFDISHPQNWNFAKISVTNSINGKTDTTSTTPSKNSQITVYENGRYWIEANIIVDGKTSNAYETIHVTSVLENTQRPIEIFDLPEKQIAILASIIAIIGIVGLWFRKRTIEAS